VRYVTGEKLEFLCRRCDADHNRLRAMSIRVFSVTNLEVSPMSTSVNVNEPKSLAKSSTSFLSSQDWTKAEGGTAVAVAIALLIVVGLVLFAVGNIYLNSWVGPTDLPFLGQFFGP
jgi:hypothetical protein